MGHNLPSPPGEDRKAPRKSSSSSSKTSRNTHRASKRIGTNGVISAATSHSEPHSPGASDKHKRVWKACERCRMKKTKCDGEFPCKRCKDDGLVCTAGIRKKVEYKQLPRGYAEVLESTQFSLIATIHKLYSMVQNGEGWDLGDPGLNDRGLPIVHNISSMLGCIRPHSDIDLPVHSVFPEDQHDLRELARQLEAQERAGGSPHSMSGGHFTPTSNHTEVGSMSDHDHSDFEDDRKPAVDSGSCAFLSPQSLPPYNDFDTSPTDLSPPPTTTTMFPDPAAMAAFSAPWDGAPGMPMMPDFFGAQAPAMGNANMMAQGLLGSDFGRTRTPMMCQDTEVMLSMGNPMMYSGFEEEVGQQMRL